MNPAEQSHRRWRQVRRHLNGHRGDLTRLAATLYPGLPTVGTSGLLTRPGWVPEAPIPLDRVALRWRDAPAPGTRAGALEEASRGVRALQTAQERFGSYTMTMQALDPPRLFDDRPSYRLLAVLPADGAMTLEFTAGSYFAAVDIGEACAHELADANLHGGDSLSLRTHVGDPTLVAQRPALLGVSVLTIRLDTVTGEATFLLHLRDAEHVTTGGGQHHVIPVGLFQPPAGRPAVADHDFDLWQLITREYAEELLGHPEQTAPDNRTAAFRDAMDAARDGGRARAYCLGLGVDPLMLATDLLAVVVFESRTFDELFGGLTETNGEGTLARHGSGVWFPLNATEVGRRAGESKTQPAGAAALALAWQGRETIGVG
ncbi:hypothetical protein ACQEVC_42375 [Plantactinospora sp. CA-294935]|uniref:hypothetical protein n=1 Tax=Plantactinospora sp. CA-294935 TaxID=3240012 RepID=UPI003D8BB170